MSEAQRLRQPQASPTSAATTDGTLQQPLPSPSAAASTSEAAGSEMGSLAARAPAAPPPLPPLYEQALQLRALMKRKAELSRELLNIQAKSVPQERLIRRVAEPMRKRSHWDALLGEMLWAATDGHHERRWKALAAAALAAECAAVVTSGRYPWVVREERRKAREALAAARAEARRLKAAAGPKGDAAEEEVPADSIDDAPLLTADTVQALKAGVLARAALASAVKSKSDTASNATTYPDPAAAAQAAAQAAFGLAAWASLQRLSFAFTCVYGRPAPSIGLALTTLAATAPALGGSGPGTGGSSAHKLPGGAPTAPVVGNVAVEVAALIAFRPPSGGPASPGAAAGAATPAASSSGAADSSAAASSSSGGGGWSEVVNDSPQTDGLAAGKPDDSNSTASNLVPYGGVLSQPRTLVAVARAVQASLSIWLNLAQARRTAAGNASPLVPFGAQCVRRLRGHQAVLARAVLSNWTSGSTALIDGTASACGGGLYVMGRTSAVAGALAAKHIALAAEGAVRSSSTGKAEPAPTSVVICDGLRFLRWAGAISDWCPGTNVVLMTPATNSNSGGKGAAVVTTALRPSVASQPTVYLMPVEALEACLASVPLPLMSVATLTLDLRGVDDVDSSTNALTSLCKALPLPPSVAAAGANSASPSRCLVTSVAVTVPGAAGSPPGGYPMSYLQALLSFTMQLPAPPPPPPPPPPADVSLSASPAGGDAPMASPSSSSSGHVLSEATLISWAASLGLASKLGPLGLAAGMPQPAPIPFGVAPLASSASVGDPASAAYALARFLTFFALPLPNVAAAASAQAASLAQQHDAPVPPVPLPVPVHLERHVMVPLSRSQVAAQVRLIQAAEESALVNAMIGVAKRAEAQAAKAAAEAAAAEAAAAAAAAASTATSSGGTGMEVEQSAAATPVADASAPAAPAASATPVAAPPAAAGNTAAAATASSSKPPPVPGAPSSPDKDPAYPLITSPIITILRRALGVPSILPGAPSLSVKAGSSNSHAAAAALSATTAVNAAAARRRARKVALAAVDGRGPMPPQPAPKLQLLEALQQIAQHPLLPGSDASIIATTSSGSGTATEPLDLPLPLQLAAGITRERCKPTIVMSPVAPAEERTIQLCSSVTSGPAASAGVDFSSPSDLIRLMERQQAVEPLLESGGDVITIACAAVTPRRAGGIAGASSPTASGSSSSASSSPGSILRPLDTVISVSTWADHGITLTSLTRKGRPVAVPVVTDKGAASRVGDSFISEAMLRPIAPPAGCSANPSVAASFVPGSLVAAHEAVVASSVSDSHPAELLPRLLTSQQRVLTHQRLHLPPVDRPAAGGAGAGAGGSKASSKAAGKTKRFAKSSSAAASSSAPAPAPPPGFLSSARQHALLGSVASASASSPAASDGSSPPSGEPPSHSYGLSIQASGLPSAMVGVQQQDSPSASSQPLPFTSDALTSVRASTPMASSPSSAASSVVAVPSYARLSCDASYLCRVSGKLSALRNVVSELRSMGKVVLFIAHSPATAEAAAHLLAALHFPYVRLDQEAPSSGNTDMNGSSSSKDVVRMWSVPSLQRFNKLARRRGRMAAIGCIGLPEWAALASARSGVSSSSGDASSSAAVSLPALVDALLLPSDVDGVACDTVVVLDTPLAPRWGPHAAFESALIARLAGRRADPQPGATGVGLLNVLRLTSPGSIEEILVKQLHTQPSAASTSSSIAAAATAAAAAAIGPGGRPGAPAVPGSAAAAAVAASNAEKEAARDRERMAALGSAVESEVVGAIAAAVAKKALADVTGEAAAADSSSSSAAAEPSSPTQSLSDIMSAVKAHRLSEAAACLQSVRLPRLTPAALSTLQSRHLSSNANSRAPDALLALALASARRRSAEAGLTPEGRALQQSTYTLEYDDRVSDAELRTYLSARHEVSEQQLLYMIRRPLGTFLGALGVISRHQDGGGIHFSRTYGPPFPEDRLIHSPPLLNADSGVYQSARSYVSYIEQPLRAQHNAPLGVPPPKKKRRLPNAPPQLTRLTVTDSHPPHRIAPIVPIVPGGGAAGNKPPGGGAARAGGAAGAAAAAAAAARNNPASLAVAAATAAGVSAQTANTLARFGITPIVSPSVAASGAGGAAVGGGARGAGAGGVGGTAGAGGGASGAGGGGAAGGVPLSSAGISTVNYPSLALDVPMQAEPSGETTVGLPNALTAIAAASGATGVYGAHAAAALDAYHKQVARIQPSPVGIADAAISGDVTAWALQAVRKAATSSSAAAAATAHYMMSGTKRRADGTPVAPTATATSATAAPAPAPVAGGAAAPASTAPAPAPAPAAAAVAPPVIQVEEPAVTAAPPAATAAPAATAPAEAASTASTTASSAAAAPAAAPAPVDEEIEVPGALKRSKAALLVEYVSREKDRLLASSPAVAGIAPTSNGMPVPQLPPEAGALRPPTEPVPQLERSMSRAATLLGKYKLLTSVSQFPQLKPHPLDHVTLSKLVKSQANPVNAIAPEALAAQMDPLALQLSGVMTPGQVTQLGGVIHVPAYVDWSAHEDLLLLTAVRQYGPNWDLIRDLMRSPATLSLARPTTPTSALALAPLRHRPYRSARQCFDRFRKLQGRQLSASWHVGNINLQHAGALQPARFPLYTFSPVGPATGSYAANRARARLLQRIAPPAGAFDRTLASQDPAASAARALEGVTSLAPAPHALAAQPMRPKRVRELAQLLNVAMGNRAHMQASQPRLINTDPKAPVLPPDPSHAHFSAGTAARLAKTALALAERMREGELGEPDHLILAARAQKAAALSQASALTSAPPGPRAPSVQGPLIPVARLPPDATVLIGNERYPFPPVAAGAYAPAAEPFRRTSPYLLQLRLKEREKAEKLRAERTVQAAKQAVVEQQKQMQLRQQQQAAAAAAAQHSDQQGLAPAQLTHDVILQRIASSPTLQQLNIPVDAIRALVAQIMDNETVQQISSVYSQIGKDLSEASAEGVVSGIVQARLANFQASLAAGANK